MNIYAERLKERVEWAGKNRGLTQEEIAKRIGIGRSALRHYWTRGGTPNERTLLALADLLEVDLNWLFGRDSQPEWPKENPIDSINDRLRKIEQKIER